MNRKQQISITMQMSVRDCLNSNTSATALIPGFDKILKPFAANIKQIQHFNEQKSFSKKWVAENKTNLRSLLIAKGKEIAVRPKPMH